MPNLAEIASIKKPKAPQPFFIYGQYVGETEKGLIRNDNVRLSEEEVLVYPGSFIFAYGTTNRSDFLSVFSERDMKKIRKYKSHFGIKNCGDINLITGLDPNAHIDEIEPMKHYRNLIQRINNRSSYYLDELKEQNTEVKNYHTLLKTVALQENVGSSRNWLNVPQSQLKELHEIAIKQEHYENAQFFQMMSDSKKSYE